MCQIGITDRVMFSFSHFLMFHLAGNRFFSKHPPIPRFPRIARAVSLACLECWVVLISWPTSLQISKVMMGISKVLMDEIPNNHLGWLKHVKNPINNGIIIILGGAGFCPSTGSTFVYPLKLVLTLGAFHIDSQIIKLLFGWRWRFQTVFIFTPNLGEMVSFDKHMFQVGWNHHLGMVL